MLHGGLTMVHPVDAPLSKSEMPKHPPASHDDDDEAVSLISAMLFPLYQANGWDYRRGDLDDFSVGCDGEEQLLSDPAPAYKPGA
ncbi:hypothetical protein MRX96_014315 [Rhipicephalus microplus]